MDKREKTKISLKSIFNYIPSLTSENDNWVFIITLIVGVVIAVIVFLKFYKVGTKKNVVAILGLCGSGKTQLFSRLCHSANVLSVTSIKESSGPYELSNSKKILVYDVPGHERIRYGLFDKVKQQAKSLIFLLDASTIQEDIKDVAEFMYTIFCDGIVQKSRLDVLVACNKQDLPYAKGPELIKSSLEKEMNLLRITKSNQLKSVGEGENNNSFLGFHGQDFEFSHLKPCRISFVECIAAEGSQINDIKKWLDNVM